MAELASFIYNPNKQQLELHKSGATRFDGSPYAFRDWEFGVKLALEALHTAEYTDAHSEPDNATRPRADSSDSFVSDRRTKIQQDLKRKELTVRVIQALSGELTSQLRAWE